MDETPAPPRLLRWLDRLTEAAGALAAWLTLVMVIATCAVVVLRRFLGVGSIAMQESVVYMHAAVFLLGAALALKHGSQVRVDVFYRRFSARGKAWVDALGALVFLLPLCGFTFWISLDFVMGAWQVGERSTDAGGLAYVYALKTLILVFAVTLALSGVAELWRAARVLTREGHHAD